MRTRWSTLLGIAVLLILASSTAFAAPLTTAACPASVPASGDAFLQTLNVPSVDGPLAPVPTADVFCCLPDDCCPLLPSATCSALHGRSYGTAFKCNSVCAACGA